MSVQSFNCYISIKQSIASFFYFFHFNSDFEKFSYFLQTLFLFIFQRKKLPGFSVDSAQIKHRETEVILKKKRLKIFLLFYWLET